ncbi:MAG TPA: GTP 3',8-cyclase MoaA [Patescibacteria group bacterium]|nr:GTP 3',8-cyclase MoaA [Patescibacteria group bacterium]
MTTLATSATEAATLVDQFGRVARSLRVSVTDRCNLRCVYCMPEGAITWFDKAGILTFEEIVRVAGLLTRHGVREIRLTGGEPLLRRELPRLVGMLRALPGVEDLAVTTNGLLLRDMAGPLLEAGVTRFNVHLDSLDPDHYRAASRRDGLERVLAGLRELERRGAVPIKVNVVLIRGVNDDEIPQFAELARTRPWQVRFIEMMPLGEGDRHEEERVVPGREVLRRIEALYPLVAAGREHSAATATVYRFADGVGDIGFINSVTEPFCGGCDRLRLTADGMVRNCLFARGDRDLKPILRGGGTDEDLLAAVRDEVAAKGPGGSLEMKAVYDDRLARKMWQIGG